MLALFTHRKWYAYWLLIGTEIDNLEWPWTAAQLRLFCVISPTSVAMAAKCINVVEVRHIYNVCEKFNGKSLSAIHNLRWYSQRLPRMR